ncbi:MAG: ParB/RepB/Spo0J family partition protein [Lachnospiraceae bacterium]|nr:ParB/RepB/Spo0J family partition protein [Lachnospiraceae bacterium]
MSRTIEGKIRINSFADLFGGDNNEVCEVELKELHDFKDHPFKVKDDEKMQEMVDSIRKSGVLVPGVVRAIAGKEGYEIISGHRRKHACELAGLETMPVIIKRYSDDEAILAMIDSNLQREEILPSEKAFAYKMKLEALSHQGKMTGSNSDDVTSRQVGEKLVSVDMVADYFGDSSRQVHRFIRLTELCTDLLDMVDSRKLKFNPAVELSYLTEKQQEILLTVMNEESVVPSLSQAQQLKKLSQDRAYTKESVHAIMVVAPIKERKVTIKPDIISRYFDPDTSDEDIEEIICGLLDEWKQRGGQRR